MQEGRRGKVHVLRRILTRSWSAACWAVRQVTENRGKKTPGIDGVIWSTPKDKQNAIQTLQHGRYQPLPLRRTYIPKADGKKQRPLGIPAMADRARQALHALGLDPITECLANPNSYGFRRERAPANAIQQGFIVLAKRDSAQWILEGDIAAGFDKICHQWLIDSTPMDRRILSKRLKAGYMSVITIIDVVIFKVTDRSLGSAAEQERYQRSCRL